VQLAAPVLVGLAMAEPVLDHGGFSTLSQVVFVALAALAAGAAVWAGGRDASRAAAHPLVGVLLAVAAFSALSAAWTPGLPEQALEAALPPAGYALLAAAVLAASARDRTRMRTVVLVSLGVCAFASGVVGLVGAATFSTPQAFDPNGVWRPAGTLEYTAALTLLEVCALPLLLRALAAGGRAGMLASLPAAVAGAVIGLSVSRVGLALALVVVAATLVAPKHTVGAARARALQAVLLVALAATAARAALGGEVGAGSEPGDWRLAVAVGVCVCAPLVWAALEAGARRSWQVALALGAAAVVAVASVSPPAGSAAAASPGTHVGARKARANPDDVLHGRGNIWSAGVTAFARRPLQGYGAAAFGDATRDLQNPVITSYAHDLPLELAVELGVVGLALAVALYALVVRAWWRVRSVTHAWMLAVPAVAFLLANLVDWPWHIAGMGAVWAAASAALIAGSDTVAPPGAGRSTTERL
jgi:hypothetical protein